MVATQQLVVTPPQSYPRTRAEILDLFIELFDERRITEIRKNLPLPRIGGFRAPQHIFIMLFPSRSGSNYFGQLLSSTGWFTEIAESFSPGQLEKIRIRENLADLHESAQWMIDHRGTPHAFGFKAGVTVLGGAIETGVLPEIIERAHVVLLKRRDRVGQAISLFKGKLGARMHTRQTSERVLTDDDYDLEQIGRQFRHIPRIEDKLAEFAARLGKSAPVFYYEDICADPVTHVKAVCDQIGVDMPWHYAPRKVRIDVLRDELSERWADRFRAEYEGSLD